MALVKVLLAMLCGVAGGALLYYDASSIMLGLAAKGGLHLPQLIGLAAGVALCGAAADFIFGNRADDETECTPNSRAS